MTDHTTQDDTDLQRALDNATRWREAGQAAYQRARAHGVNKDAAMAHADDAASASEYPDHVAFARTVYATTDHDRFNATTSALQARAIPMGTAYAIARVVHREATDIVSHPADAVTVEHVRQAVGAIRDNANDPAGAHALEDNLWQRVLRAIANGSCTDPVACAAEALQSSDIQFPRWRA